MNAVASESNRHVLLVVFCCLLSGRVPAQDRHASRPAEAASWVPPIADLRARPSSELRAVVDRFSSDRSALLRRHSVEHSPERSAALKGFLERWRARLDEADFDSLGQDGRADFLLLRNRISRELGQLSRHEHSLSEMRRLVPFCDTILGFHDARLRIEPVEPAAVADAVARLSGEVEKARRTVEGSLGKDAKEAPSKVLARRTADFLADLERNFEQWYRHHAGYDPTFTWWISAPYRRAKEELSSYGKLLREKVVGIRAGQEEEPIIGDPIGREALLSELAHELIPYAPEDLVAIARREFAWCEEEMRRASRDMGLGEDWKAALERVKSRHVEPGRQPALVRELALEAIAFVESRALVTVPPLAKEVWRLEMMSPERQKTSPFFLGGEVIQVAFPTDAMAHDDKLMSLRGNNMHFARATVHHELVPGHHLQGFMTERYQPHRRAFATPFWTEGWALYWEMLLWELGFQRSPEDRVGMLFWRMHRCARIVFSLSFHLGQMTPQECIDFLVDRVGHERANATAEVRRSFAGTYAPLYQAAYLLGGMQFRALRRELVESGKMKDREFHDAILQANGMPVEMVRALLTNQRLARDFVTGWKFAGEADRPR